MQADPIWREMFDKYYDVFYQEMLLDRLVNRWLHLDIFFRLIVAVSASGSAISGWAIWSQPDGKVVWIIISSIAALVAVIYGTIPINQLIKDGNTSHSEFSRLRTKFEQLIMRFKMDEGENLNKHAEDLKVLINEASDLWGKSIRFPMIGRKLREETQSDLNQILASKDLIEGISDEGK